MDNNNDLNNNAINPMDNNNNNNTNENKDGSINPSITQKKTQTFNLIIGIATLLIALLGATFAYFTATARSGEGEVTVKSAMVSINFERGTEVKASNLIPSSQKVALSKFQKQAVPYTLPEGEDYISDFDEFLEGEDHSNLSQYLDRRCVDANGREVCSVFWFTVKSDGQEGESTDILGYIDVVENGFQNLSYLVYEVDYERDENKNILKDKYGFGVVKTYHLASEFEINESAPIVEDIGYGVFKDSEDIMEDGNLVGTISPVACLFGETDDAVTKPKDDVTRCKTYSIENLKEYSFQIVIWLEETGSEQLEQGKKFNGTVGIETVGDGMGSTGRITGKQ